MKRIIFIVALFSCSFLVFSQNGYFDQTTFAYEDAVIFEEKINYEIAGKKIDFIEFVISKSIMIDLKSQKAVDYFANYVLTKLEDPLYVAHAPTGRNYSPLFSNLKVNYFEVNKVLADGEREEIKTKASYNDFYSSSLLDDFYDKYYEITYHIDGLNIGDTIIIEYSYTIPYNENFFKLSSNRFFFNSNIYKEKTSVKLSHNNRLKSTINYYNDAKPDTIVKGETFTNYVWELVDLQPNIFEEGSKAYKELPYVVYSLFPYDLLYELPNSFQEEFLPYYSILSYLREKKFLALLESAYQGVNNKQFSQTRKYIGAMTSSLPKDSKGEEKIKQIHNDIALNFQFSNDIDYFKKKDTRNPRMGDYITKKTIRDIKRYDVYAFILFELKHQFYTVYLADHRYGVISEDYFKPMSESDYLFSVLTEDRVHFLYPKKSRFGYLFGEIPFYFQNTDSRFVHLSDYRAHEQAVNTEMRKVEMPISGINDNYRKTNTLVNVNLQNNTVQFNARINLSGQYSTMTRGVYQYNVKDETINPIYNQKIWENISGANDTSAQAEITNKEFPFNANVNASFTSSELIQQNGDRLSIDLSNWFKHIIYPAMDTKNRTLDFYPDFQMRDTYVYFLKFDKEVQLAEGFDNIEINNDFGELEISINQMDPHSIKITSSFAVVAQKIKSEEIEQVKEIYEAIEKTNKYHLKLVLN